MKLIIRFTIASENIKKLLDGETISKELAMIELANLRITLKTLIKIEFLNSYDADRCQLILDDLSNYIDVNYIINEKHR